ncbi:signal peptidase I [Nocardioides sp.]|uniref:signal peptidase I n=1 Tax=Nocardioides sp. TaxID=35761 RepID=UPI00271C4235|nr:signal peptidase I [Nocardioides sp.]MDO9457445.1 signal peptidase I [Nocardioides sp.]
MSTVGVTAHRRTEPAPRVPAPVRWVGGVLLWAAILGCLSALVVGVLVPRLAGATPYTILTGSMVPHYPPGTLVVDKPVDPEDIAIGTVVTYQLHSGEPTVVTHRVVAVNTDLTGKVTFTTQGDANEAPDAKPVIPEQIRGQLWYAVPYLGYANNWLTGHQRQTLVYLVAGSLGLYALSMFVGSLRDRRRTSSTRTTNRQEEPCDA